MALVSFGSTHLPVPSVCFSPKMRHGDISLRVVGCCGITRGLSPTAVIQGNPPLDMWDSFLGMYHTSGCFPQPCSRPTWKELAGQLKHVDSSRLAHVEWTPILGNAATHVSL